MEAARADEEAAARMAASSHSGSPRFHTPPDGPSILAHLAHSGALNGKVCNAMDQILMMVHVAACCCAAGSVPVRGGLQ
jgi:hypothetical protein